VVPDSVAVDPGSTGPDQRVLEEGQSEEEEFEVGDQEDEDGCVRQNTAIVSTISYGRAVLFESDPEDCRIAVTDHRVERRT